MADFEMVFMDAGQGDCTAILYPDGSMTLVDCGSTKSGSAAFVEIKKVIDQKFDAKQNFSLVLTHPDEDHYNLLSSLKIENYMDAGCPCDLHYGGDIELYRNQREDEYTYKLISHFADNYAAFVPDNSVNLQPDLLLSRAGVNVTILAGNCTGKPAAKDGPSKNTNSLVLLVEYLGAKVFLMGDAFVRTEQCIIEGFTKAGQLARLQKQPNEHVVLKMGHHGSDTSTSAAWMNLIKPEIVVVSSGTKSFNGKGMPTKAHLQSTVQCTTLTTTDINQSYVVFDEAFRGQSGKDFVTMPKTKNALWTTCYQADWEAANSRWFESGQSWYYGVEQTGKKKPLHWQGYTGYDV